MPQDNTVVFANPKGGSYERRRAEKDIGGFLHRRSHCRVHLYDEQLCVRKERLKRRQGRSGGSASG